MWRPETTKKTGRNSKSHKSRIKLMNIDMKKITLLFIILFSAASCENKNEKETSIKNDQNETQSTKNEPTQVICNDPIVWIGSNNKGAVATFIKIRDKKWIEPNNRGGYRFTEIDANKDLKEYILADDDRKGIFVKLTPDRCFLKTNEYDYKVIYKGSAFEGNFMKK